MAGHIKHLIEAFLKEKKKETGIQEKIKKIIDGAVDKKLTKYIQLKRVYKNNLIFCSSSSGASFKFNLKKRSLLEAVKKEFPQIKDVKIEVG
ncbi:MAG: DUF721 domain-containing protein [Candidatus Omnitrophica bacterium]|nr:DUF721 domain-containing protein [Candidatus Omnitrophota bacterium]MBU1367234.1 DUF721 domain-containing protein [Candidatus Omnitrophota bacterium]MBU1523043.1 DUF721 domain-containing protein [Candidatus Omnitrophota bacterium]MBU2436544.1 DUF721 domain-containing protein [Candidatus Omnitrophota bacterium]